MSGMFLLGRLFAYYIEMPPALNFLFHAPGNLAVPFISFRSYVSFATRLMRSPASCSRRRCW